MGVQFGSLTSLKKVDFKFNNKDSNVQSLLNKYDSVFQEYEAMQKSQNSGGKENATASFDIKAIQNEIEKTQEKLEKFQTMMAQDSAQKDNTTKVTDDKDEKNKVKGKSLGSLSA